MNFVELSNVIISIFIACIVGAALIFAFLWLGESYALDERIFPTATLRQRTYFGFVGFYLLILTGVEILGPQSYEAFLGDSITYKPSLLGVQPLSGISIQDILSFVVLLGLIWWFYSGTKRLSARVHTVTKIRKPINNENIGDDLEKKIKELKFAFSFSALSFLIAVIAPSLRTSWWNNLVLSAILGIFLVSGIYCFIEAMKLGARYGLRSRSTLWTAVFWKVLFEGTIWYLFIGGGGYFVYSVLPSLFVNSDNQNLSNLPVLIRTMTKVVAGVFVILAAYIVAWGLDGLGSRLLKFMPLVSCSLALFPLYQMGMNYIGLNVGTTSPFDFTTILYAIILLSLPLIAYFWSVSPDTNRKTDKSRSIAFVRDISWAPFVADTTPKSFKYEKIGFASAEELLEDIVGHSGRTRTKPFLPLPIWHWIAARVGLHKDYDAVVIDLMSALRLRDALIRQGRNLGKVRYFIAAGIFRSQIGCIDVGPSTQSNHAIWSGPPYLRQNVQLEELKMDTIRGKLKQTIPASLVHLPANCIRDFIPEAARVTILPEPFATDLKSRLERSNILYQDISESFNSESTWIGQDYHVLMISRPWDSEFIDEMTKGLLNGIKVLKELRGPAMFEDVLAPAIAAAIDPEDSHQIDRHSVTRSVFNLNFDDTAIIDPSYPSGRKNWEYARWCLGQLRSANIVSELDENGLGHMCVCNIVASQLGDKKERGKYPLSLQLLHVEDTPGRLKKALRGMTEKSIDLRFMIAQRIGAGQGAGFIYLLPKDSNSSLLILNSPEIQAVIKGTIGFIPVTLEDQTGELERMLSIISSRGINIDSCFAFSIGENRAIALLALGEISQDDMDTVTGVLHSEGYETPTDF